MRIITEEMMEPLVEMIGSITSWSIENSDPPIIKQIKGGPQEKGLVIVMKLSSSECIAIDMSNPSVRGGNHAQLITFPGNKFYDTIKRWFNAAVDSCFKKHLQPTAPIQVVPIKNSSLAVPTRIGRIQRQIKIMRPAWF